MFRLWCVFFLGIEVVAFAKTPYQKIHELRRSRHTEARKLLLWDLSQQAYSKKAVFARVAFALTEVVEGVIESYPFEVRLEALRLLGVMVRSQKETVLQKSPEILKHLFQENLEALFEPQGKDRRLVRGFLLALRKKRYFQALAFLRKYIEKHFRQGLQKSLREAYVKLRWRLAALFSLGAFLEKAQSSAAVQGVLETFVLDALMQPLEKVGKKLQGAP